MKKNLGFTIKKDDINNIHDKIKSIIFSDTLSPMVFVKNDTRLFLKTLVANSIGKKTSIRDLLSSPANVFEYLYGRFGAPVNKPVSQFVAEYFLYYKGVCCVISISFLRVVFRIYRLGDRFKTDENCQRLIAEFALSLSRSMRLDSDFLNIFGETDYPRYFLERGFEKKNHYQSLYPNAASVDFYNVPQITGFSRALYCTMHLKLWDCFEALGVPREHIGRYGWGYNRSNSFLYLYHRLGALNDSDFSKFIGEYKIPYKNSVFEILIAFGYISVHQEIKNELIEQHQQKIADVHTKWWDGFLRYARDNALELPLPVCNPWGAQILP